MWPSDAIWCHRTWSTLVQVMACWHQIIICTNVDLSSMRSCGIHLRAISQERLKISMLDISLKIINLILQPHLPGNNELTHWGRVTHICVSKLTIIGSDNGLSPGRRQAIIWTNAGILLIRTLGTNFSEILSAIKNGVCEMASILSWPWCVKTAMASMLVYSQAVL